MGTPLIPSLYAVLRLAFWTLTLIITALAWLPVDNPELTDFHPDKINHVGAFAALTVTLHWAYTLPKMRGAMLLLGYGLLIETVQHILPYRTFSLYDIAANILGILTGCAALALAKKLKIGNRKAGSSNL